MKEIIIIIAVALVTISAILFSNSTPKPSVTTPELKKVDNYQRPVREGNCWRQWDTAGNSFLVCH